MDSARENFSRPRHGGGAKPDGVRKGFRGDIFWMGRRELTRKPFPTPSSAFAVSLLAMAPAFGDAFVNQVLVNQNRAESAGYESTLA